MKNAVSILRKNTMLIVLVLVYLFFAFTTKGSIFMANNFSALISQNAYVYVLATGMLMCMLTGGNIDLSCGSFICFIGAVGGILMVKSDTNPNPMSVPLALVVLLVIGVIYGCVLGYLIAYVNVPPWIATLAGYLAFRGWATALLSSHSMTGSIAPFPELFLKIFSGKLFETAPKEMNVVCMVAGIVACLIVLALNIRTRSVRLKKGYEADSIVALSVKSILTIAVILLITYKLSLAGGIPTVLAWVVVIVLIYDFITDAFPIDAFGNLEEASWNEVKEKISMDFEEALKAITEKAFKDESIGNFKYGVQHDEETDETGIVFDFKIK